MKIVILNKKELQDLFPTQIGNNKSHSEIHQSLFNIVRNNYNTENIIEVLTSVCYKVNNTDGDCLFRFEGKNKDIFFYSFESTII